MKVYVQLAKAEERTKNNCTKYYGNRLSSWRKVGVEEVRKKGHGSEKQELEMVGRE